MKNNIRRFVLRTILLVTIIYFLKLLDKNDVKSSLKYVKLNILPMEDIIALVKRRGFIYPGSDIYGGLSGTWDYGPLGVILKRNIVSMWWKHFVNDKDNVYGVESAIIMNPKVWEASGHVQTFSDPLCEDIVTKQRFRTDHILKDNGIDAESLTSTQMDEIILNTGIKSPNGNKLSKSREFNMMFSTNVGATDNYTCYLRPETAQGIFTNYKNILDSFRPKLPFGIAQHGKSFRNEISPRNFIFRSREFEQLELEYFVQPDSWEFHFDKLLQDIYSFLELLKLPKDRIHEVDVINRAHYSAKTIDIEYDFPFGREELLGLAYRSDFDLCNIQRVTGKNMFHSTENKFIPHVIEPSFGVERLMMAVLCTAFYNDVTNNRIVLKFPYDLAPIKYAVFPLLKNKQILVDKAKEVYQQMRTKYTHVIWDDNDNIGKKYRRQDEIGTPYCVVIDFTTLEDNTVTIRDRDTMKQERIYIADL